MLDIPFSALFSSLAAVLRQDPLVESSETALILEQAGPAYLTERQPHSHWTDEMLAVLRTSDHPAALACLDAFDMIPWGVNPVADRMTEVGDILLVAPMLGPDGPIWNPNYRMGLYYQKPGTYYQLHSHTAAETYFIIAGDAVWTAGDDTRHRGVGDVIHHPSEMPHAFRAGPDGLFAIWRWSGDIRSETYALLPDNAAA